MKPEHINQARDAIAGRSSGRDTAYYWSGDPDKLTGFKEAVNTEYIIRSLDLNCGWEAALDENKILHAKILELEERLEYASEQLMGEDL